VHGVPAAVLLEKPPVLPAGTALPAPPHKVAVEGGADPSPSRSPSAMSWSNVVAKPVSDAAPEAPAVVACPPPPLPSATPAPVAVIEPASDAVAPEVKSAAKGRDEAAWEVVGAKRGKGKGKKSPPSAQEGSSGAAVDTKNVRGQPSHPQVRVQEAREALLWVRDHTSDVTCACGLLGRGIRTCHRVAADDVCASRRACLGRARGSRARARRGSPAVPRSPSSA
jgi:hypothetical protein